MMQLLEPSWMNEALVGFNSDDLPVYHFDNVMFLIERNLDKTHAEARTYFKEVIDKMLFELPPSQRPIIVMMPPELDRYEPVIDWIEKGRKVVEMEASPVGDYAGYDEADECREMLTSLLAALELPGAQR